jgi:hypothetical protein
MRTHTQQMLAATLATLLLAAMPIAGQAPALAPEESRAITTPMQEWGHNIGDNYFLANYQQLEAYWKKLDQESARLQVVEIGRTALDRPHYMAIVTSPENFTRLDRYKEISRRLSLAEGLTDEAAHALAREGKAVVWIDGGLHASELLGAQQLLEQVYQMVSRNDEETRRILNDVITLAVLANPDGMDLQVDHYMRHYGDGGAPVLYNHYAGHDNNRDSFMAALPETTNMNRVMYREWYPQIMYNHHQSGPGGSVMFAPPFRDPHNYNFHPLVPAGLDMVAAAMHTRFIAEGKPGVVSKNGASYSTWWNGGLRTTAYFHNQIGILTETIGSPTPGQSIPFNSRFQVSNSSSYFPIEPQEWLFRYSIDYSVTANYAILDLASRYRETFLYRIYRMGADSRTWGNEDHWTTTPHEVSRIEARLQAAAGGAGAAAAAGGGGRGRGGRGGRGGGNSEAVWTELRKPENRDPRGFIMPAGHPDFGTTVRFANTLMKAGVEVQRATAPFTVAGTQYPAGSLVVETGQAFRAHVMDMFEPQDHPDDIPYEGANPTAPYDVAGWTLAYTMGVKFDRVLDGFDGPFEMLTDFAKVPAGSIRGGQNAPGYYFSHESNDSFIAINRLVAAGETVSWLRAGPMGAGTFYVAAKATTRPLLEKIAADLGVNFEAATSAPAGEKAELRKLRIGLYDQYGGGMPSGWTRLLFENFDFPFEVVFPPMLDAGNLREKYDVIVFNDSGLTGAGGGGRGGRGAGGAAGRGGGRGGRGGGGGGAGAAPERDPRDDRPPSEPYPQEYARRRGSSSAQTLQHVQQFVHLGGTVIAIGGAASNAVAAFNLPLSNHLEGVGRADFFVPGSVLRVAVDPSIPVAHGYGDHVDIFYDNSPTWNLDASAGTGGTVRPVAWFDSAEPLRSGWAWGQDKLNKGIQMAEATVGEGRVYLFGNELLFRTQPHGNYRFFFNALYLSVAPGMK